MSSKSMTPSHSSHRQVGAAGVLGPAISAASISSTFSRSHAGQKYGAKKLLTAPRGEVVDQVDLRDDRRAALDQHDAGAVLLDLAQPVDPVADAAGVDALDLADVMTAVPEGICSTRLPRLLSSSMSRTA